MTTPPTMGSRALAAELPETDPELAVMARNGITRITVHLYRVDGFRYTSLDEALAQVRRGARARETAA